jgi:hypothetical protein
MPQRHLSRTHTQLMHGVDRSDLMFFFGHNSIRKLPAELFELSKLTALSLRAFRFQVISLTLKSVTGQNALTEIPPAIGRLVNLRELNLANNKLRFLPSEMLQLRNLKVFSVEMNLLPEPPNPRTKARQIAAIKHPLPKEITLVELCLRKLLSPLDTSVMQDSHSFPKASQALSLLRQHFTLPLYDLPPNIGPILSACEPGASRQEDDLDGYVFKPVTDPYASITSLGACPSPRHDGRKSVFAMHAEERMTWEVTIGTISISPTAFRWRGCQWGCLDYLDPQASVFVPDNSTQDIDLGATTMGVPLAGFGDEFGEE